MRLVPFIAAILLAACARADEINPDAAADADANANADADAPTGVDATVGAACPDGQVATAITAGDELTCTSVAGAAAAAVRSRCSVYLGHRDNCTGCTDAPAKWSASGTLACTAGPGNLCVAAALDSPSALVRLGTVDLDGNVNGDDKLYTTLHCLAEPSTPSPAPCQAGWALTGRSGDRWTCGSLAETAVEYLRSQCSIYLGWQDGCDGCTTPPTKWGRASDTSCENGAGDNNTCTTATLGAETVRLFGLNTAGDVDGNDKLHLALACAATTISPPTRTQTACPPGQFVRAIDADGFLECVDPDAAVAAYVDTRCSLFFGWRDSCDACTAGPTKWGMLGPSSCTTSGGVDDTCTAMSLGGRTVQMYGLSTDGNVNGDDTLYAGLRCDL